MAARLRKTHQEDVKTKIQCTQLVNLLQNHALKGSNLDASRIDAAKFLLNKRLSNAPTEVSGPEGAPLTVEIVRFADSP